MINLASCFPAHWKQQSHSGGLDWSLCGVERKYFLLMTGRSGSTHLTDLMHATGKMGQPQEFFNERYLPHYPEAIEAGSLSEYLYLLARQRSLGRCFGFKIDIWRLNALSKLMNLEAVFPRAETLLIAMTRKDKVAQAYSFATARATERWHDYHGTETPQAYRPNDRELWYELFLIASAESLMNAFIAESGREALSITYEDLLADSQATLANVARRMGIEGPLQIGSSQLMPDQPVHKLKYMGKEERIVEFSLSHHELLVELETGMENFSWQKMAEKLREKSGIEL